MNAQALHAEHNRVLIVDDEAQIRKFLRISLEAHGMVVAEARLGEDGIALCHSEQPEVVVLDLGLPDMDGQEVVRRIREWSKVPIIVLSVRSDEAEKVAALDAGANDYVTKPFGISELIARIRVALRNEQRSASSSGVFQTAKLEVDLPRRRVRVSGDEINLSPKEYAVLRLLVMHPDQVLTHSQILREIWGDSHDEDTHYLRVLIGHLRQKLGDDPTRPQLIETIRGIGYRLSSQ